MKPICLPAQDLQDTDIRSSLAGIGKYFRASCLTNSLGPMKFHYCEGEKTCGLAHNCKPKFFDGLKEQEGCVKSDRPPSKWSKLCSRFFHFSNYTFPDYVDEVHLLEIKSKPVKGRFLETCYRQDAGEHGWCRTRGQYYALGQSEEKTDIRTDWGWGFCSEECNQVNYFLWFKCPCQFFY